MGFHERYRYDHTDLLGRADKIFVYRAYDTLLNRFVALKFFNRESAADFTILDEIKGLLDYSHPNIIRYYDATLQQFDSKNGEKEYWEVGIMEYVNGGNLLEFIRSNSSKADIKAILKEVLVGLQYIHEQGIIHRQISPQNILLKKG